MKTSIFTVIAFSLMSCQTQSSVCKTDSEKVDSVFTYYFSLMKLEIDRSPVNESSIHLYQVIVLESDTVYMLKDLPQAISLLSELSEIKVLYSEKSAEMLLTREMADSWIKWYGANRQKILWSEKMSKPILSKRL